MRPFSLDIAAGSPSIPSIVSVDRTFHVALARPPLRPPHEHTTITSFSAAIRACLQQKPVRHRAAALFSLSALRQVSILCFAAHARRAAPIRGRSPMRSRTRQRCEGQTQYLFDQKVKHSVFKHSSFDQKVSGGIFFMRKSAAIRRARGRGRARPRSLGVKEV
jgi:hypothetical protein